NTQIDPATAAALSSADWRLRLGAVAELTQHIHARDGIARAARLSLQRQLEQERDYAVRTAISAALEPIEAAAAQDDAPAVPFRAPLGLRDSPAPTATEPPPSQDAAPIGAAEPVAQHITSARPVAAAERLNDLEASLVTKRRIIWGVFLFLLTVAFAVTLS